MRGFSAQPFHYGHMAAYVSKRCKSGIRPAAERIQPKARIELKPGDHEYEKIKASIECFGYAESIIVNRDLTVVGGGILESKPSFSLHLKKLIKTDSKLKEDEIIKSDFAMLFGDD